MILYIALILFSIVFSVIKTLKKDETERTVKKNRNAPISVETTDPTDTGASRRRERASSYQTVQPNEYFSYETMSDQEFASEFDHSAEEAQTNNNATTQPHIHLTCSEEEVFKGIVWSEILKRKY